MAATSTAVAAALVGGVGVLVTVGLLAAGDLRYRAKPTDAPRPVVGPLALGLLATGSVVMGACALALILA